MALFDSSDTQTTTPASGRPKRRLFELGRLRPAELFDAWMFAETDATLALATWRSAVTADDKRDAHAAYLAALDREAHAASILEQRLHTER
jgi:hypothetical protein